MSHNINLQHIIFRTYNSRYSIPADDRKRQIVAFLISESQRLGTEVFSVNAHLNHIHILVDIGASITVADYVKTIKANSSRVFKGHFDFPAFEGWARKYGSFSISRWDKERIINYINNQEEHHRHKTFAEELAELFGVDVTADKWWRHDWFDEEQPK